MSAVERTRPERTPRLGRAPARAGLLAGLWLLAIGAEPRAGAASAPLGAPQVAELLGAAAGEPGAAPCGAIAAIAAAARTPAPIAAGAVVAVHAASPSMLLAPKAVQRSATSHAGAPAARPSASPAAEFSAAGQQEPVEPSAIARFGLDLPLGGAITVQDQSQNAFGFPVPGLDDLQRRAFQVGNSFFRGNWIAAPASAAGRDGLGPLFNARSCGACHGLDGRGLVPEGDGTPDGQGLLLRLGIPGPSGDLPEPRYGGQLQDQALPGIPPEALPRIRWIEQRGVYADGQEFHLRAPRFDLEQPAYGPFDKDLRIGARLAPQLIGLGLLEAIPLEALLARADPEDRDGDGISGRVHWLPGEAGQRRAGRFGWKATQADLEGQIAAAFVNDIGITSALEPDETLSGPQAAALEFSSGGQPEVDPQTFERVVLYSRLLAVPAQRGETETLLEGARLFEALGCAACHTPLQSSGPSDQATGLSEQRFRPYTDLLLHDLGPGLADQKQDGDAAPAEWRTPPLWGLGLVPVVNGRMALLHDGRARDFAEAILWHGGEAQAAREAFRCADADARAALIRFLSSL
jgi:CxxC motif-containing protein (DUF1111 family)